jgi:hypothetical protein
MICRHPGITLLKTGQDSKPGVFLDSTMGIVANDIPLGFFKHPLG